MSLEDTIDSWGLKRRPPASWTSPPFRREEAIAVGGILGCGLALAWFCLIAVSGHPARPMLGGVHFPVLAGLSVLFYTPVVILALLPLRWLNSPANPRQREVVAFVFLLRESGFLRKQVDPLLLGLPLLCLLISLVRADPAAIGLSLALLQGGLVLWLFPSNPFLTQKKPLTLPDWVTEMLESEGRESEEGTAKGETRANERTKTSVVPMDVRSDFSYVFSDKLPEEIQKIGVAIGSGVLDEFRRIASQNEGRFYQGDDFKNVIRMIRLDDAPANGVGLEEMRRLTAQALTRANHAGWTRAQLAIAILHFVQIAIRYAYDKDTTGFEDYGRFPLETLKEGVGDCECTSILCCALLSYFGFDCALLLVQVPATPLAPGGQHAAVGLLADTLAKDILGGGVMVQAPNGSLYLYGETACDDHNPPSWGGIPENWRKGLRFDKVVVVPSTGLVAIPQPTQPQPGATLSIGPQPRPDRRGFGCRQ